MLTLYCILDPLCSGSETDPIQFKEIKAVTSCSTHKIDQQETDVNNAQGNWTGLIHWTAHFTSGAECCIKIPSSYSRQNVSVWNRSIPCHNRQKNRAGPVGSSVNRRSIRYGFRGAPIIDPVQCERGLTGSSLCERRLPLVELFLKVENL